MAAVEAPADPGVAAIDRISAHFLGVPYVHSPLGEGEGVDADPRLRFDAMDCMTYVETVLALSAMPEGAEAQSPALLPLLDDIRYDGAPSFAHRNHFVESQWIPSNLRKGWIRAVSREIAGAEVRRVSKVFGPDRWRRRRALLDFPLAPDEIPSGEFELELVPFSVARKQAGRIPSGTILFVVRSDAASQPSRVTHVGIVFQGPAGPTFRHASRAPYQRVFDEPFEHFLKRNAAYDRWPVVGFAAFATQVPLERARQLLGAASP